MPATYEPIETLTASGSTTTFSFSSLPTNYTDLVIVLVGTLTGSNQGVKMRFNGDSASNYLYKRFNAAGSPQTDQTSSDGIDIGYQITSSRQMTTVRIASYRVTNFKKLCFYSLTAPTNDGIVRAAGEWNNTGAITSITLVAGNNYSSNTTATLYGIASA